jgi:hypothetical protein
MKKNYAVMFVILAMVVVFGCATTGTPPADCPDSVIWKNKQVFDVTMSVAITGFHVLAATKPEIYKLAHESAQAAAALLRSQPVSLGVLTDNVIVNMLSPLLGLIPMDKILCSYDRIYIAGDLERI